MGVVEAAGPDGRNVRAGDRVVVPFTISCGDCFFCGKAEPSPTAASNSAWQPVGPLPESTLSDEPVLFLSDIHSGWRCGSQPVRPSFTPGGRCWNPA